MYIVHNAPQSVELKTLRDLLNAESGFIVLMKRPGANSRIHRADCKSFDMQKRLDPDTPLGTGKSRQRYHRLETLPEAMDLWRNETHRQPVPCKKCCPF